MSSRLRLALAGFFLIFALVTWILNSGESQSEFAIKAEKISHQLTFSKSSERNSTPASHAEPSIQIGATVSGHSALTNNSDIIIAFPRAASKPNESSIASHALPSTRVGQSGLSIAAEATQPPADGSKALGAMPIWEIEEGLPLPLVLSGGNSGRTDAMKAANESITQKFEQDITTGRTDAPEVVVTDEVWVNAKSNADGIFKILYGDAVYNARGMEAASSGLNQ